MNNIKASPGILLRQFRVSDIPELMIAAADPEIQQGLALAYPLTDSHVALKWINEGQDLYNTGQGIIAAVSKSDDTKQLLGCIELRFTNDQGPLFGYWTMPHLRRQGIAKQALKLAYHWATREYSLTEGSLLALPENYPSHRVALACGFEEIGEISKYDIRVEKEITFKVFRRRTSQ